MPKISRYSVEHKPIKALCKPLEQMPRKKAVAPKEPEKVISDLREEEVTGDIIEALNFVMGNRPSSFIEEFKLPDPKEVIGEGAAMGGTSAQAEFIKKKDPVEVKTKLTKNKIYIFDLTNEPDKEKYEDILNRVFDPESGIKLAEPLKDPTVHIDEKAPLGYRAIVMVKTTKPVEYVVPKGTGYKVVEKASKPVK